MATSAFRKATKRNVKLRMAIAGATGSGKTYSALALATHLGKNVFLIDTEGVVENPDKTFSGTADKYSDEFDFQTACLTNFHPQKYIDLIHDAENAGADVIIIDSMSHAWMGEGGVLDQVDKAAARDRGGNKFAAWKVGTPIHRALIDAILRSKAHVICTMRSKMDYEIIEENGRKQVKKLGMAPIQRDDVPYEFDVIGDMDSGTMVITKTRIKSLFEGVYKHPGAKLAEDIKEWMVNAEPMPEPAPEPVYPGRVVEPPAVPGPVGFKQEYPVVPSEEDFTAAPKTNIYTEARAAEFREYCKKVADRVPGFTEDNMKGWLNLKYGITTRKDATEEMLKHAKDWLIRCHRAGKVVE